MGKITVTISDEVEKQLRRHVAYKYPEKTFGKLSQVVEEAIKYYLKKEGAKF